MVKHQQKHSNRKNKVKLLFTFLKKSGTVENEECPVGSGGSDYLLSHGDGSFSM